jgi:hypothetical protein
MEIGAVNGLQALVPNLESHFMALAPACTAFTML